ncbi:unnamed protein product, partial [Prorocentrum cordatum]
MWPGWAIFAGSAVGSFFGGLRAGGNPREGACNCDCHISYEGLLEPSEKVLALLGQQLERRGPGHMAPKATLKFPAWKPAPALACPVRACEACEACAPCAGLPWWWLVVVAVGAFTAGAALGVPLSRGRRRIRAAPQALFDVAEEPDGRVGGRGADAGASAALP